MAGGAFGRQHDGVGAVEHGGRDVRHLGAGRHRRVDHRFEHLRRDDDRLAEPARDARVMRFCRPGTFSSGISTPRSPRATMSAIGNLDDLVEPLRSPAASRSSTRTAARPRVTFLTSATSSARCTNETATQSTPAVEAASRSERSLSVIGRDRNFGIRQADALAVRNLAGDVDDRDGAVCVAARHMQAHLAVVDEQRVAGLERAQNFRMRQMTRVASPGSGSESSMKVAPLTSLTHAVLEQSRCAASGPADRAECRSGGELPSATARIMRTCSRIAIMRGMAHIDAEHIGAGVETGRLRLRDLAEAGPMVAMILHRRSRRI